MICRCRSRSAAMANPYWRGWGPVMAHGIAAEVHQILRRAAERCRPLCPRQMSLAVDDHRRWAGVRQHAWGLVLFGSRAPNRTTSSFAVWPPSTRHRGRCAETLTPCARAWGRASRAHAGLVPTALAWHPTQKRWLLLPENFAWARAYGITDGVPATDLPAGQDSGRFRPEVSGQLTIPPTPGIAPGRPRIDAWVALGH